MTRHHFDEDYNQHVNRLMQQYPIDEAMSLAVGGNYEGVGQIERDLLFYLGLKPGMTLLDFGCGSGRLAAALAHVDLDYTGTDVVQDLLDYAKTKCPPTFKFVRHANLTIPAQERSLDFISAFSVFTHLHHHETFIYLEDGKRALRPGGFFVFSFLEFGASYHWPIFLDTVALFKTSKLPHLNQFIERSTIEVWAKHLGFDLIDVIAGEESPWGGASLGQSTAVLKRPI